MNTLDTIAVTFGLMLVVSLGGYLWWTDPPPPRTTSDASNSTASEGKTIFRNQGCHTCHSTDGSAKIGPTMKNLYGSEQSLKDGKRVTVTESYLRSSIRKPKKHIADGFPEGNMPSYNHLSEEKINKLISFIKSLSENEAQPNTSPHDNGSEATNR